MTIWGFFSFDAAGAGAAGFDHRGAEGPPTPARRHPPSFDDVDYDDMAPPRTASRLTSGTGGRGGPESPGSASGPPQIVALNETDRGPSRIGATLYQAPSPHSGFTATQNVVSSSAVRPVDADQVSTVEEDPVVKPRFHLARHVTSLHGGVVVRASDLRLEIAGSVPAAALSSATLDKLFTHIVQRL